MNDLEQAIFDIIKEPLTLGSVDDLGVISDSDAMLKTKKIMGKLE